MLLVNPEVNETLATFAQKSLGAFNRLGASVLHFELYFRSDGSPLYLLWTLLLLRAQIPEIWILFSSRKKL